MDAFTTNSFVGERARRTCVRDRSIPITSTRETTALPDPTSFDPRAEKAGFMLRTVVQAVACALPVIILWVVLT